LNGFGTGFSVLEQSRWVTPDVSILKAKSFSHVELRSVQQALNSGTVILEYVLDDPASWCLVIRRDSINILRLGGRKAIEADVAAYLNALKQKQPAQIASRRIYDAILKPAGASLKAHDVLIVRDGALNLLPFDALQDSSGSYAGEHSRISYLPSAGSFYLLSQQARTAAVSRGVLAFGAIPYQDDAPRFQKIMAANGYGSTALQNLRNSREEVTTATASMSG
jgi:CHAT domain-containing protein